MKNPRLSYLKDLQNKEKEAPHEDIYLPGINVTPTLEAHTKRLETYFTDLFVMDMNTFWSKHVSEEEKQRITKLEIFDEIEEWQLISKHYCFVLAIKNYSLVGWST
ncbi:hypothetical protein HMI54_012454 [Coelomomyces lativittatus]|nr:hypothetical protein HMI54_012454 [Coelomomyces lativittatus]